MKEYNLDKFPWGRVERTYEIAEYIIIEYQPYVYIDGRGTKMLHDYTNFHPILEGKGGYSYDTLDQALIGVISRKYEKHGDAARYFFKMIGIETQPT